MAAFAGVVIPEMVTLLGGDIAKMLDSTIRLAVECIVLYVGGKAVRLLVLSALGGVSCPLAWNISGLAIAAVWTGYVCWRDWDSMWRWGKPSLGALVVVGGALVGLAAGRGLGILVEAVTRAPMVLQPSQSAALDIWLLTPIREEVFWRGFVLRRLSGLIGIWPALAVSGILFGLVHPNPLGAVAVGLFLGYLYSPSGYGHLAVPIAFHLLLNATSTIPLWVPMGF